MKSIKIGQLFAFVFLFLFSLVFPQAEYPNFDFVKCETGFTDEFGIPKTQNEWGYCHTPRDGILIFQGFTYDVIREEKQRRDLRFSIGILQSSEKVEKFLHSYDLFNVTIIDVLSTFGKGREFAYEGNFKIYDDSLHKSPEFLLVHKKNGLGDYIRSLPDTANKALFSLYDSLVYFPDFDREKR